MLKGLITAIFTAFNAAMLSQNDSIVEFYCANFKNETGLCRQFWEHDYFHPERRALLDLAASRFPYDSLSYIKILTCLVGDNECARHIFGILKQLHSFTTPFDERISVTQIASSLNASIAPTHIKMLQLTSDAYLPGMTLPSGCTGLFYKENNVTALVKWQVWYPTHLLL